jgi:hypothetical protein
MEYIPIYSVVGNVVQFPEAKINRDAVLAHAAKIPPSEKQQVIYERY